MSRLAFSLFTIALPLVMWAWALHKLAGGMAAGVSRLPF